MNANAENLHNRARTIARVFTQSLCRLNGQATTRHTNDGAIAWEDLPADEKKMLEDVFVDVLQRVPPDERIALAGGLGAP